MKMCMPQMLNKGSLVCHSSAPTACSVVKRVEIDRIDIMGRLTERDIVNHLPMTEYNYALMVYGKLKEAGIPIVGTVLPRVDFTKGDLTMFADPETMSDVYIWKPKLAT